MTCSDYLILPSDQSRIKKRWTLKDITSQVLNIFSKHWKRKHPETRPFSSLFFQVIWWHKAQDPWFPQISFCCWYSFEEISPVTLSAPHQLHFQIGFGCINHIPACQRVSLNPPGSPVPTFTSCILLFFFCWSLVRSLLFIQAGLLSFLLDFLHIGNGLILIMENTFL